MSQRWAGCSSGRGGRPDVADSRWCSADLSREWMKVRLPITAGVLVAGGLTAASALGVAQTSPGAAHTFSGSVSAGVAVATSVAATLSPILAIVFALVSFSLEFRNRMWSTGVTVAGGLDRMLRAKVALTCWVGIGLVGTMVGVAVGVFALQGTAPPVRASWQELIGSVLLVPCLAVYWFILTSLMASLVRPVALAGILTFLLASVEVPLAAMLGGGWVPMPLSASLALYPLLDYPAGGWATPPTPVAVDPVTGAVALLAYGVAGLWGTRSRMRAHLSERPA